MFWRSKGWCCGGLKDRFERRYDRGLFVFAEPPTSDGRYPASYWLAMRSVRKQDVERLKELKGERDLPITIQTWFPIQFCPWCGTRLKRFYARHYELLVDPQMTTEHGWQDLARGKQRPEKSTGSEA
jgi:hypothetical protein